MAADARLGRLTRTTLPALIALLGCAAWSGNGPECTPATAPRPLPDLLSESSGLTPVAGRPGLFWTHNDQGPPTLYAIDGEGTLVDSLVIPGAENHDWEDLASGPCEWGECVWVADVGDNQERRESVTIYRVEEAGSERAPRVLTIPVRFEAGPRDTESIFVLPGERIYLVTKGRSAPVGIYELRRSSGEATAVAVEIQRLGDGPEPLRSMVTGAEARRDGTLVAIRSYRELRFYRSGGGRFELVPSATVDLTTLRESQGEAVTFAPDGTIWLSSEAGPIGGRASIVSLRCRLPD